MSNQYNPRLLLLLLVVTVAVLTPAFAQDKEWSPWDVAPSWFLRAELLSIGADAITYTDRGAFKVGLAPQGSFCNFGGEWHGVRLGLAATRMRMQYLAMSILPVSVGYTILRHPYNYAGRLIGSSPEVYVQFTADWADYVVDECWTISSGSLALCGAIDRYGLGLSASLGVDGWIQTSENACPLGRYGVRPFLGVQMRLATLTAGF